MNWKNLFHLLMIYKYKILVRGPYLWNKFLTQKEKSIEFLPTFKESLKSKLLNQ